MSTRLKMPNQTHWVTWLIHSLKVLNFNRFPHASWKGGVFNLRQSTLLKFIHIKINLARVNDSFQKFYESRHQISINIHKCQSSSIKLSWNNLDHFTWFEDNRIGERKQANNAHFMLLLGQAPPCFVFMLTNSWLHISCPLMTNVISLGVPEYSKVNNDPLLCKPHIEFNVIYHETWQQHICRSHHSYSGKTLSDCLAFFISFQQWQLGHAQWSFKLKMHWFLW